MKWHHRDPPPSHPLGWVYHVLILACPLLGSAFTRLHHTRPLLAFVSVILFQLEWNRRLFVQKWLATCVLLSLFECKDADFAIIMWQEIQIRLQILLSHCESEWKSKKQKYCDVGWTGKPVRKCILTDPVCYIDTRLCHADQNNILPPQSHWV